LYQNEQILAMHPASRRDFVRNLSMAVTALPFTSDALSEAKTVFKGPGASAPAVAGETPTVPSDTTADIIVDKLIAWNVQYVFGLTGDGINPLVESLRKKKDRINYITARHEESAAFMASGYG
jgi:hypothetical protein